MKTKLLLKMKILCSMDTYCLLQSVQCTWLMFFPVNCSCTLKHSKGPLAIPGPGFSNLYTNLKFHEIKENIFQFLSHHLTSSVTSHNSRSINIFNVYLFWFVDRFQLAWPSPACQPKPIKSQLRQRLLLHS